MLRLLAILLVLLTGACASRNTTPAQPHYFVMRHLHTPAGEQDPDLTAEGQNAARLLAARLAGERPRAIYVSRYKRAGQTAAPLAERLGLTPIVYDPADTPGLIAQLRRAAGPVLVVGHSNTVPDIVEQLGAPQPGPLAHEDFGDIWIIGRDGSLTKLTLE